MELGHCLFYSKKCFKALFSAIVLISMLLNCHWILYHYGDSIQDQYFPNFTQRHSPKPKSASEFVQIEGDIDQNEVDIDKNEVDIVQNEVDIVQNKVDSSVKTIYYVMLGEDFVNRGRILRGQEYFEKSKLKLCIKSYQFQNYLYI